MQIETDGVVSHHLTRKDFDADGNLIDSQAELGLVVRSAEIAEGWIGDNVWAMYWRDAITLYNNPRPLEMFGDSYVMAPNVQRWTIATTVNSVIPALKKGMFYQDPPFLARPRAGTSKNIVDAKTAVARYVLDKTNFKNEVNDSFEQFALLGTCIVKWGVETVMEIEPKRKSSVRQVPSSSDVSPGVQVVEDEPPQITEEKRTVTRPWFRFQDIRNVFVAPNLKSPDITKADYVIDQDFVDYYDLKELKDDPRYDIPEDFIEWFFTPAETSFTPGKASAEAATQPQGFIPTGADETDENAGDPLRRKLEILEFQDKGRIIAVINRKHVIRSEKNEFGCITYFSANWWNRPKSFWGIGLGTLLAGNQRVDQGAINAILKQLSFGSNASYLKSRDSGAITQMMRTGLGKVHMVDGEVDKAYRLLDTPKIDPNIWQALRESQQSTESTAGADGALVGGSSAGPRNGMGRSAGGANLLANASATRLEGPLDHFIDQVFVPWLFKVDELVFRYMSDKQILDIIGKELGSELIIDMQEYHDGQVQYDVLAGTYAASRQIMVQSLTILTQWLENPQLQEFLAEVHGEYIDLKTLTKMYIEASQWGDTQDLIKPLTPQMKEAVKAKKQMQTQLPTQQKLAVQQAKFEQQSQLEDQKTDNRIKRDFAVAAVKASGMEEAISGEPGEGSGLGGFDEAAPI